MGTREKNFETSNEGLVDINGILNLNYDKIGEDYLFNEQLKLLKKLCNEHDGYENKNLKKDSKNLGAISIVGERGSGKSSFLYTAKSMLESEGYYVLDILDPNVFNDNLSFIEIFISIIYNTYKNEEFDDTLVDQNRIKLNAKLKEIANIISDIRGGKENFYQNNSNYSLLESISNRVGFVDYIKEVIGLFLDAVKAKKNNKNNNKDKLIVMIDDMDLISSKVIYDTLEDVRKYFCQNLIVIVSYRDTQVLNAIIDNKITENLQLLDKNVIAVDEIKEQANKYVEKLFPLYFRVRLYSSMEILQKNEKQVLKAFIDDDKKLRDASIKSTLFEKIYERTRIQLSPVDEREDNQYLLPNNLRGILQMYSVVDSMIEVEYGKATYDNEKESYMPVDSEKRENIAERLLKNIEKLNTYFISFKLPQLEESDRMLINEWISASASDKNYVIWREFYKRNFELDNKYYNKENYYFNYNNTYSINSIRERRLPFKTKPLIPPQNVQLGDVYEIIEENKNKISTNDYGYNLVYFIKLIYSIELLSSYLEMVSRFSEFHLEQETNSFNVDKYFYNYMRLTNGRIMPSNFYYLYNLNQQYQKEMKIINYKNYDRLINDLPIEIEKKEFEEGDYESEIKKFIYSKYGAYSRIYSSENVGEDIYRVNNMLLYDYDGEKLETNTYYKFDVFSFLLKTEYLEQSITKRNYYVFYSMFDIDCIVHIKFGDASKEFKLSDKILKKIQDELFDNSERKEYWDKISLNVFNENSSKIDYILFNECSAFIFDNLILDKTERSVIINKNILINRIGKIRTSSEYDLLAKTINELAIKDGKNIDISRKDGETMRSNKNELTNRIIELVPDNIEIISKAWKLSKSEP